LNNHEVETPVEKTADERKTWVTPAATIEQVSELTKGPSGPGLDVNNCHS